MKLRKLSLIRSLLIASSSLCITSVWGANDVMKEEITLSDLSASSFISIGTTSAELESEFLPIGQTPREILNLNPKNVDIIQGDESEDASDGKLEGSCQEKGAPPDGCQQQLAVH